MAVRILAAIAARPRLFAIGLVLAGALGAAHWAFSTMLEPASLLQVVGMVSLC